jgi:phosphoglycolate phosphatase
VYKAKHLPNTVFNDGMENALEMLSPRWHLAVVTAKPENQAVVAMNTNTMGVLWGFGSVEELSTAGAHVIADTPADLLKTLLT